MHHFLANWLILIGVFSVALASPGPDFVMIVRNAVRYSRRSAILCAVGLGLGVGVHVTYCLAGLALVIAKSVMLFNFLKWMGAAYLFYIGLKALRSQGFQTHEGGDVPRAAISDVHALRTGFVTNLLNPKATLFFLALFTQIADPHVATGMQFVYGATCVLMTMLWFTAVATVLTTPSVRSKFLKMSKTVDRVCGGLFIALGVKLIASKI